MAADTIANPTQGPFAVPVPAEPLAAFCRRWRVARVELFGSVLRPADFRPDSDVDVMVTFEPGVEPTAYMLLDMGDQLTDLFGRPAHLTDRDAVEQADRPAVRRAVLESARVIYEK